MREKLGNISVISDWLKNEMATYGADNKTIRNALLAVEELLLLYKDRLQNENIDVKVETIRDIKHFALKISVLADEFSPDALQKNSNISIFDTIIRNSGFSVNYSYSGKINQIEIVIKQFFGFFQNLSLSFKIIQKKTTLFLAFFSHILCTLANLTIPILTGQLILAYTDDILTQILITASSLLIVKLVYFVSYSLSNILYSKIAYYSETALRNELINKMLLIKNSDYENDGTGTFIKRVTTDIQIISSGITGTLDIISDGVYYVGILVATIFLNFWVFLAEVLFIVILALMEKKRAYRLDIDRRKAYLIEDSLSGSIIDFVNGISEIKLLNAHRFITDKISDISDKNAEMYHIANRNTRYWIIAGSCTATVISFLVMVFLGYGLHTRAVTIPVALILFNYFTLFDRSSVSLIQRSIDFFKRFNLATERVRNLYNGSEFNRESYGDLHIDKLYGDIVFNDVTFAYNHDDLNTEDNNIIQNVSFNINKGETVAFVGKSGSGKSTLLRLLSGQVTCYSGAITIDGHDLSEYDSDTLYNNMSVISQTTVLFNCSIKENLLIAKPNATMEELRNACQKACILEDIENTENGFDTLLGERGVRFSGGQRQRLAIARALLRNTNILLLDEATSAMDNVTQDNIISTINHIDKGHTIMIIAHRLSTIRDADRIMVVGDKKILASGTHNELLQTCEEYRMLYQSENTGAPSDS